jgi:hypothetical protein
LNPNQIERAAYIAAHRIMTEDLASPELACPGARRSAHLDAIAKIIKSVFEVHSERFDETTYWWPSRTAAQRARNEPTSEPSLFPGVNL